MAKRRIFFNELVILIIFLIAILAFSIPAIYNAQQTPDLVVFEQNQDTTVKLTNGLDASLDLVDSNKETINVTILDTKTGTTNATGEISQGTNISVIIEGETVIVNNKEILNSSKAIISYEYPTYYGWPSGAEQLVSIIPILPVGSVLILFWYLRRGKVNG